MPAALLVVSWFAIDWPESESKRYPGGTVLRDAAGNIMRVSLGEGDVDCRPYYFASRDDWIVKALIASEDGSFWTHRGVRPLSILRAAYQNLLCHRRVSGASTITMQAVRLICPHPKTLWWKFREAVMAVKMEREKDKLWILSQYLNRAPFGSNLVGIEAAACGWFGKSTKELGLGEAAMLAGMVQAPSRFRPDRGFERALRRRDYVLARMLQTGAIDSMQMDAAKSVCPVVRRQPRPFANPHYCDWIMARLEVGHGGDIVTPLDADVQAVAKNAVDEAALRGGCSVAAVVMRRTNVVALACSGDYFGRDSGQVNTALAPRPAGSTLKPFLTALAIDRGLVTPQTRLLDAPVSCKGYRPANFDAKYRGLVTVKDALVLSLNIPFVKMLGEVGVDGFGGKLRELGFSHLGDDDSRLGLGMAIGNAEITLMELVQAYAKLADNGGGVFSEATAYLVADMLSGAERSGAALGHVADVRLPRFAWKTGTSSAYRDAWTVLWNPEMVIGVWCGHKSGGFGDTSLVGAKAAAPVAWKIARAICSQGGEEWFARPSSIVGRRICSRSGMPANPYCPETEEGCAIEGISSPKPCDVHVLDAEGMVATRDKVEVFSILSPTEGAVMHLAPGTERQNVVFEVSKGADRLWWFADGMPVGETNGAEKFTVNLGAGEHVVSCSAEDGVCGSVCFRVK